MLSLPSVRPRLAAHWSASRLGRFHDRLLDGDPAAGRPVLLGLLTIVTGLTWGAILAPTWDPPAALVFPVLLGGVLLGRAHQILLTLCVLVALTLDGFLREPFGVTPGTAVVMALLAATVLCTSRVRLRLGLRGHRAETVLLELSDRLQPAVTPGSGLSGWSAAHALIPAGGARFSGDFLISAAPEHPGLHVALVDVSGKGSRAAGRALQLSGALRALLDAVAPHEFLEAANDHVFRRGWDENFATAVHASLDPDTGRFEVYNAGHHPAARWHERDQRWERLAEGGPALGLLAGEHYQPCAGVLEAGDALLLFTDGLVERPGQNLDHGTGRLLEAAAALLRDERVLAPDCAARLIRTVAPHGGDDRAVLLLRRDPPHLLTQPPAARRQAETPALAATPAP